MMPSKEFQVSYWRAKGAGDAFLSGVLNIPFWAESWAQHAYVEGFSEFLLRATA